MNTCCKQKLVVGNFGVGTSLLRLFWVYVVTVTRNECGVGADPSNPLEISALVEFDAEQSMAAVESTAMTSGEIELEVVRVWRWGAVVMSVLL